MNEQNNYEINRASFQVKGNVMWFPDYFIQLSNISQVSTAVPAPIPYPPLAFIAIILGAMLLMFTDEEFLFIIGLGILALAIITMVQIYQKNNKRGCYVNIQLNSGALFRLKCQNQEYATYVMESIRYCVDNKNPDKVTTINCGKIENSNVIVGDNNNQGGNFEN